MIEHVAAAVLFVVTWPVGFALCYGAIRLYLKVMP